MNKIEEYLTRIGVVYEIRHYSIECINAEVASKEIGFPYEQMYKTLLCLDGKNYFVTVIPSKSKLNNKYRLSQKYSIEKVTAYKIGTVSPILLDQKIRVLIDKSVNKYQKVSVGCGEVGKELIISSRDLIKITNGIITNGLVMLNKSDRLKS